MHPLRTYDDWKHCITVLCGIDLTSGFVAHRLVELRNPSAYGTQRFVASWGEQHLKDVIGWFEQAERELAH
jgi:hypothetical protein